VSLLELLVVLMIIVIVTAVVIPTFGGGVSNVELRGAARSLASGLRLARSEAVSQRRETFLVLDVAGRRFKVDRDPQEHALPRGVELKPSRAYWARPISRSRTPMMTWSMPLS